MAPAPVHDDYWLNTSDALFAVSVESDDNFVFGAFNPSAQRMTGLDARAVQGRRPAEVLPPDSAQAVIARYRQCVREGRPITYNETLHFPTGESHWNTTLTPVSDEGRVVRLLGCSHRIAEPLERDPLGDVALHGVLDGLPNGIALLDETGAVLFINATWQRFGERNGGIVAAVGDKYLDLCDDPRAVGLPPRAGVAGKLRRLLSGTSEHFEHRYAWKGRHFLLRASGVDAGGQLRAAIAHTEVTEAVAAQEMLARSSEQLLHVQEEERARIALELHDSTSQHLVAVGLSLASLRRSGAPPHVLDDMRRSLAEAHREIRTLTYVLYPPKLSTDGLEATLRTCVDGYRRRTGLSVATSTFGDIDKLPLTIQRTVFRVVQESLANVHRHAGAQRVAVDISLKRRGLRVIVADDGRRESKSPGQATGVGIRGMQARFGQFSGELTVSFKPFGAVVQGFIPAGAIRREAER